MGSYGISCGLSTTERANAMTTLTFRNDKSNTLSRMMQHAMEHKRRIPYTKDYTEDYGLILVKDDGIYLMSPAEETFNIKRGGHNTVVYARGYKPTKSNEETLWHKTHDVSGDDFAEFVRLDDGQWGRVMHGGHITIDLSETELLVRA